MTTDYGADPLGNGQWKLHPSGQIVDRQGYEEWKRTKPKSGRIVVNDILGMSWTELEMMQGGKLKFTDGKLKPRK